MCTLDVHHTRLNVKGFSVQRKNRVVSYLVKQLLRVLINCFYAFSVSNWMNASQIHKHSMYFQDDGFPCLLTSGDFQLFVSRRLTFLKDIRSLTPVGLLLEHIFVSQKLCFDDLGLIWRL